MRLKIYTVGLALLGILSMWAWAAVGQEPESQPTSAPVVDPVCEAVVTLAAKDTSAFDEAMVSVSADLSDEEFGRYSRLYKSNFTGADYPSKVRNAYEKSPITAHAMQGAALTILNAEAQRIAAELAAVQAQMAVIQGEFGKYGVGR